ncbi:uncharacterized protein UTRI_06100 [Ustilago trichophora]|uniref:Coenzyme Q-binding protein COQ10 START domain-containing protein n=1 Tax=Ustilago trichophora TaxID=86804 RepID=A0A5C3EI32_9BASI|nr:uncharacterized protein UTRI_06100 [Ustilago trichophora]
MSQHTLLVVGGAGFLGSAISKAALAKGWRVLSISPSGTPYHTPAGHRPAWSSSPNIEWHAADALDPSSYAHLADRATAAVHTVGILLESDYKSKSSQASPLRNAIAGVAKGWGLRLPQSGADSNPLHDARYPSGEVGQTSRGGGAKFSYEHMNRDSAIAVAHTFLSSLRHRSLHPAEGSTSTSPPRPAPFIYISAEDLFRPVVDARYIRTKRQAESAIARLAAHHHAPQPRSSIRGGSEAILDADGAGLEGELRDEAESLDADGSRATNADSTAMTGLVRPVFLRPGLMYHPHTRPGSTLPAAILEASAALHRSPPLPLPIPTPAQLIAKLGGGSSPSQSMARLLTTPPLHIDTVAKAVCAAIEDQNTFGVVDVYGIRKLAGWKDEASLHGSVYGESIAGAPSAARSWPSSQQPLQAASRPTSPLATRHTSAVSSAGQQRTFTSRPQLRALSASNQRSFFSLPDLGKLASTALSSSSSPASSSKNESRSYRDPQGRTVYETSKILSHPSSTLFQVVADVDAYKQFVPYCQDSRVLGPASNTNSNSTPSDPPAVLANLTVGFGRFSETYTSKVTLVKPSSEGKASSSGSVVAEAVQPNPVFSYLSTKWTFHPIQGGERTLVEFSLTYAFRNPVYGAVAGNVFEQMSAQMIDAFEQRADKLHPTRR